MEIKKKLYTTFLVFLFYMLVFQNSALAEDGTSGEIVLKPGAMQAVIDGETVPLPVAPVVDKGITLTPLRLIAEGLKSKVSWDETTKKITVETSGKVIELDTEKNEAMLNGTPQQMAAPPVIINGFCLVPLRFVSEYLGAIVTYISDTEEIHISLLPPPNQPPSALFKFAKSTVDQGETVEYIDECADPDGDKIINWEWTGKKRAFFSPGEYTISLRCQDVHNAWSKPFEATIVVTDTILMDEITYNFFNPIPGEQLDMSQIPVTSLPVIKAATTMTRDKVLFSDCPEVFTDDGILCFDTIKGTARIHYHHQNGAAINKYIYLLAINQGLKPAKITIKKQGTAGPGDPMSVGRVAAYTFLASDSSTSVSILPGETKILNATEAIPHGYCADGLFNVDSSENILFSIVATGNPDPVAQYPQLEVLSLEGQTTRGTFSMCNRSIYVNLDEPETSRIIISDGDNDFFLYGKDKSTNRVSYNTGNYGVLYDITIETKFRTGVVLSARGGPLAGAGKWDGQVFYLPNSGILNSQQKGALIGVLSPGQQKTLRFSPPSGSFLPVNLIFIPF